jgi:hypothetical protein
MKKITTISLILLILAVKAYSQDNCRIELQTDYGIPTEAKFYLKLGKDSIQSKEGTIEISQDKYNIYKEVTVKIYFNDEVLFTKLYKLPPFAIKATPLKELCRVHTLERKF